MALGGLVTDMKPTSTMNVLEQCYAKCRPECGVFGKYIVDAQRTVDVGEVENPAIPARASCARHVIRRCQ